MCLPVYFFVTVMVDFSLSINSLHGNPIGENGALAICKAMRTMNNLQELR